MYYLILRMLSEDFQRHEISREEYERYAAELSKMYLEGRGAQRGSLIQ